MLAVSRTRSQSWPGTATAHSNKQQQDAPSHSLQPGGPDSFRDTQSGIQTDSIPRQPRGPQHGVPGTGRPAVLVLLQPAQSGAGPPAGQRLPARFPGCLDRPGGGEGMAGTGRAAAWLPHQHLPRPPQATGAVAARSAAAPIP